MIYLVVAFALTCVLATIQAFREQHLVVLRWPVGRVYLELGTDARYEIISPSRLPMAVVRFSLARLAASASLVRRAGARAAHLPVAAQMR